MPELKAAIAVRVLGRRNQICRLAHDASQARLSKKTKKPGIINKNKGERGLPFAIVTRIYLVGLVSPNRRLAELLRHELRIWHPTAEVAELAQDDLPTAQPYALAELRCTGAPERPLGQDRPDRTAALPARRAAPAAHRGAGAGAAPAPADLPRRLADPPPAALRTASRATGQEHGLRAALERRAQQPRLQRQSAAAGARPKRARGPPAASARC